LALLCIILALILGTIGTLFLGKDVDKPLAKWRKIFLYPIRILSRVLLFSLGYHYIKTKGKPASPKEAPVIVANHISAVDGLYLFYVYGCSPVAKAELNNSFLIRPLIKSFQTVLVNRTDAKSRQDTLDTINNRAQKAISGSGFPQILIFPEGTTTNGSCLISYKVGAFVPGLPVQPVCLNFQFEYLDPSCLYQDQALV
jgi:lysophosphatidylcholine acyltransferase/lyso-PAF acetyltransferase